MSVIKGFIFKYKKILTFLLLSITSLILIFSSNNKITINLKSAGFSIIYPFQFIFHSTGNFFQNTFNSISELKESQEEIKRLRIELEEIKKAALDFKELKRENSELTKLLELKKNINYKSIACEVIGRDPKKLYDILILNKGSNAGIKINLPVISYEFGKRILVGKILEVTSFSSKVITLHNPNLSINAVIDKNNIYSVIQGDARNPGIIKLNYVPKDFVYDENSNYYVITSGDSYLYPKGLEIGKIVQIYQSKRYEMFNTADVEISANLSQIEYVLVLAVDENLSENSEELITKDLSGD